MKINNILTGELEDFEELPVLKNVPIFNGAVNSPLEQDKFFDLNFVISRNTGIIQLLNHPDIEEVYKFQTKNIPFGNVWQNHHIQFSKLIKKYNPKSVIEIGGAQGYLANLCMKNSKDLNWTIVEPNPNILNKKINIIQSYFHPKLHLKDSYDAVVHSHVFEHFLNPLETALQIAEGIKKNALMFASIPNLWKWVEKCQPNGLNFEHTYLLSKVHFEQVFQKAGFEILETLEYGDGHSIFYVFSNTKIINNKIKFINLYEQSLSLYKNYLNGFKESVLSIVNEINLSKQSKNIYIFGAHLFTQFLIVNGLNNYISLCGVLDNNPSKKGLRLYGSDLRVFNPSHIKHEIEPIVIVKAGNYTEEINKQLISINPKVRIIN